MNTFKGNFTQLFFSMSKVSPIAMTVRVVLVVSILIPLGAFAHPIPDIPVRSFFDSDGGATIQVEVDPRCFAPDPLNEPYLVTAALQSMEVEEKAQLFSRTKGFIARLITLRATPGGPLQPAFDLRFTAFGDEELTAGSPDSTPVVITAECKIDASDWEEYQVASGKEMPFSVQVINVVKGERQPLNVLFPGEESQVLDLQDGLRD